MQGSTVGRDTVLEARGKEEPENEHNPSEGHETGLAALLRSGWKSDGGRSSGPLQVTWGPWQSCLGIGHGGGGDLEALWRGWVTGAQENHERRSRLVPPPQRAEGLTRNPEHQRKDFSLVLGTEFTPSEQNKSSKVQSKVTPSKGRAEP